MLKKKKKKEVTVNSLASTREDSYDENMKADIGLGFV